MQSDIQKSAALEAKQRLLAEGITLIEFSKIHGYNYRDVIELTVRLGEQNI